MTRRPVTGRCLCGGVRFTLTGPLRDVVDCHCHRCRRFSGHHLAATATALEHLELDDEEGLLTWWSPVDEASYGFCQRCGSSLFWASEAAPDRWSVCAGTLDPPTGLRTTSAIHVGEAGDYHVRADLLEHETEPATRPR